MKPASVRAPASTSASAQRIDLRVDDRSIAVPPGTTVAAALWSAGISSCRTSLSGEPRGPVCGMGICFECRVTIDGVPHQRACMLPCARGMVVETGPASAAIAASAATAASVASAASGGRSTAPGEDPAAMAPAAAATAAATIRTDVAVVGAGPAGLAAACRAAEAGAAVVLLDEAPAPGGQVWRRPASRLARAWSERFAASGARFLARATVIDVIAAPPEPGATPGGAPGDASAPDAATGAAAPGATLLVDQAGRGLRIEARRLVIATGARERFLPFPGWTLPNAVGVGGVQALLKSGAALGGRRVVIAGSGPLLLPVAAALAREGARIALVAEQAPAGAVARFAAGLWRHPRLLAQAVRYRAAFWRAPYRCGVWVSAACGDGSPAEVREATLTDGRRSWRERCDLLACAYGLVPNLQLARLLGCALCGSGSRRVVRVNGLQQTSVAGVYCAGEPTGIGGLELALLTGQIAGIVAAGAAIADSAAGAAGAASGAAGAPPPARELASLQRRRDRRRAYAAALDRAFQPRAELRELPAPETLVCRCEDVPLGKLDASWSPRQAKLYTRAGMGPCQGRVCGPALELLRGWDEPDTVRAPLEPVALATLASLAADEASSSRGGGPDASP
jgi:NADPH-dependent 2,4-dienoyl-CoA reductase/sulfur reductase-like enzyme